MKRETAAAGPLMVPGVVSLAASSRRTLKHGDSFAMFDALGDIVEVEHSPGGWSTATRAISRASCSCWKDTGRSCSARRSRPTI
jgi:hypothetical protein